MSNKLLLKKEYKQDINNLYDKFDMFTRDITKLIQDIKPQSNIGVLVLFATVMVSLGAILQLQIRNNTASIQREMVSLAKTVDDNKDDMKNDLSSLNRKRQIDLEAQEKYLKSKIQLTEKYIEARLAPVESEFRTMRLEKALSNVINQYFDEKAN